MPSRIDCVLSDSLRDMFLMTTRRSLQFLPMRHKEILSSLLKNTAHQIFGVSDFALSDRVLTGQRARLVYHGTSMRPVLSVYVPLKCREDSPFSALRLEINYCLYSNILQNYEIHGQFRFKHPRWQPLTERLTTPEIRELVALLTES